MSYERGTVVDTLDYIASMLGQLQSMARSQGHDMLAYLIDMAQLEAREQLAKDEKALFGKERDSAA